ncbi:MAG: sugar phosphate isomerase/epimerase [Defluviitaleaceae bacterium]|nr:sugar phosphate isomerase/epimerase [Defluviitaleaceae bacterium]
MDSPVQNFFKVGLIHFMAYPEVMKGEGPILETLKKILVDDYFDAIEITHISDNEVRNHARELLVQSHMTICYGAQPRLLSAKLNPNDLDEDNRKKAESVLIDSIDEAEFLGAGGIAFLSGKWDKTRKDECYSQLKKTTENLCRYAAAKYMSIELEVFDYDFDKASLIGPAPYAAAFAADMRMNHSNFGLLCDLSHFPQTYETSRFALSVMKPYITHLHIGNAVMNEGAAARGDTHPRFGFAYGSNDVPEVLDFLRECKREELMRPEDPLVLSFEVKPWGNEDSEIVIANAKRVLNKAWALL